MPARGKAVHALQRGCGDEPAPRLGQLELIARQRERHAVDGRAGGVQVVHRVLDDRRDAPVDRDAPEVGAVRDPHAGDGAPAVTLEVRGAEHRVRVARVRAGQDRQPERDVRDRPGHEPLEHERRGPELVRAHDQRHTAQRLLEPDDPAPRRRDPRRPAAVGGLRERHHPVRHGGGAAAGGPAAVAGGGERVAGRAEQPVVADAAEAEDRAVRLAQHDRPGRLHALDPRAAEVRREARERGHAAERRRPSGLEVEEVLHRGRDAVQRADRLPAHEGLLRRARLLERLVDRQEDERVQRGIAGLDPPRGGLDGLHRRDPTRADRRRNVGGRRIRKIRLVAEQGRSVHIRLK